MVKWERSRSVKCRHSQAAKPHSHPGRPLRVDTEVSEALVCLLWSRGGVLQQGGKSLPSRPPWVWGRSRSRPGGCGRSHPAGCCRAWCPWRRTEEEKQGICQMCFASKTRNQNRKTGSYHLLSLVSTCVVGVGHRECTYVQHKHTKKRACVSLIYSRVREGTDNTFRCVHVDTAESLLTCTSSSWPWLALRSDGTCTKSAAWLHLEGLIAANSFLSTARNQQWKLKVVGFTLKCIL